MQNDNNAIISPFYAVNVDAGTKFVRKSGCEQRVELFLGYLICVRAGKVVVERWPRARGRGRLAPRGL